MTTNRNVSNVMAQRTHNYASMHPAHRCILYGCKKPSLLILALLKLSFLSFWLLRSVFSDNATNLDKFHMDIKQNELYPENSPFVDSLLNDMATQPILHVGKFAVAIDEAHKFCFWFFFCYFIVTVTVTVTITSHCRSSIGPKTSHPPHTQSTLFS